MSSRSTNKSKIAIVMDGSRRNYDVAVALHIERCLYLMFADWYAVPGSMAALTARIIRMAYPGLGQRMLERYTPSIPSELVSRNSLLAIRLNINRSRFPTIDEFVFESSKKTSAWIKKCGFGETTGIYCYIRTIDTHLCRMAREMGIKLVGEQMIAPAEIELEELEAQQAKWPGWEISGPLEGLRLAKTVEMETWPLLDKIVAPSHYVVEGLQRVGVAPGKIELVPYPADFESIGFVDRTKRMGPLRVGFVGQVNLRKNAPVFLEIAKQLHHDSLVFEMVGKCSISEGKKAAYSDYVSFSGSIPRSKVSEKLRTFDVFLFPSTCEGAAGAVFEAMASGLPIITTRNSGTPVVNGREGFIHAPDDIDGFIESIKLLQSDKELRLQMGVAAHQCVQNSTLTNYGRELVRVFNSV